MAGRHRSGTHARDLSERGGKGHRCSAPYRRSHEETPTWPGKEPRPLPARPPQEMKPEGSYLSTKQALRLPRDGGQSQEGENNAVERPQDLCRCRFPTLRSANAILLLLSILWPFSPKSRRKHMLYCFYHLACPFGQTRFHLRWSHIPLEYLLKILL